MAINFIEHTALDVETNFRFKKGDIVICVDNPFEDESITVGEAYEVTGRQFMDNGDEVYALRDRDGIVRHALGKWFSDDNWCFCASDVVYSYDQFMPQKFTYEKIGANVQLSKVALHQALCEQANTIYAQKNNDYGDSFAKTRRLVDGAIMVRIYDKVNRLETLLKGADQQVVSESIDDTLLDLANYCLMELVEREIDKREVVV